MRSTVQDLQNELNFLPKLLSPPEVLHPESKGTEETTSTTHLLEVIPVVTFASLMIEISSRIQAIVETVEELAELAEFKGEVQEKDKQNQPNTNRIVASQLNDDQQTMKALERVWVSISVSVEKETFRPDGCSVIKKRINVAMHINL